MEPRPDAIDVGRANLAFARELVDRLHASGVAAAFVCPGSRSTPLALAVAEQAGLPHAVHIDERSAAFHALGFAKATGRPVLLVCTSGTAGANFLPAVAEASHARVPLIVLTADRPSELRAWGAPQTMEQRGLFAGFTRWSEESPCPSERVSERAYARALALRAVTEATGPAPGPVHLNLPFREPLLPDPMLPPEHSSVDAAPLATIAFPGIDLAAIARQLADIERGVLVFGPDPRDPLLPAAVAALAARLGWPVIADPASGLRGAPVLDELLVHGADLLLRDEATALALVPDCLVRFGGPPTSKAVNTWLARHDGAELWLVDPAAGFRDPQHRATRCLRTGAREFCAGVAGLASPPVTPRSWLSRWTTADRIARAAAAGALAGETRLLTPQLATLLWDALPADATLYVSNSMPVRDVDAFAGPRATPLQVLANRGVNGIDGLVSAALGASAALHAPTVLWCGDLALLHDVSGLLAGAMHDARLTIVVSNDDGGGIFEYLPSARLLPRPVFEHLFAVPHARDLARIARGLGWQAVRAESPEAFRAALSTALAGGLHLIEVPVDRAANTAHHARINARVAEALAREWRP